MRISPYFGDGKESINFGGGKESWVTPLDGGEGQPNTSTSSPYFKSAHAYILTLSLIRSAFSLIREAESLTAQILITVWGPLRISYKRFRSFIKFKIFIQRSQQKISSIRYHLSKEKCVQRKKDIANYHFFFLIRHSKLSHQASFLTGHRLANEQIARCSWVPWIDKSPPKWIE